VNKSLSGTSVPTCTNRALDRPVKEFDMEETTDPQRSVLRRPYRLPARDESSSGYGVRCARCDVVSLSLAEFRKQISSKPYQKWHCPKCGSVAVLYAR